MLNKKGAVEVGLGLVVKLIAALIILSVLVMIVLTFLGGSGVIASDWICKISVGFSHGTKGLAGKLGLDTIMCYTQEVKSEAETKDEVLEDIAEHMRKCWNMWGEGKLNPEGKNIFKDRQDKCFTCYKMNFPDLDAEVKISLQDIYNYLEDDEVNMEDKLNNADSYWNYFKMSNAGNFVDIILPNEEDVIKKDRFYAITYTEHVKPSTIGNLITGAGMGYVLGTSICTIGTVSGWFTVPSLVVCGAVGTGGGIVGKLAPIKIREFFDNLIGLNAFDGITFTNYEAARNTCVTVEKVKK